MRRAILAVMLFACGSCDVVEKFNDNCTASASTVGTTSVALDVRKRTLRSQEAPVGNLVADAIFTAAADPQVVAAIQNSGGIRPERCAGGERDTIAAGTLSEADVEDLLPFENYLTIVTVTGAQLKSVLERSVSALPEETEGWFLQVSKLSFTADCTLQRQVLSVDETAIVTDGARVTSITIAGAPLSPTASYRIVTNDYVASGEDGFLAMRAATSTPTAVLYTDALETHLAATSPVAPAIEGRITLTGCTPP